MQVNCFFSVNLLTLFIILNILHSYLLLLFVKNILVFISVHLSLCLLIGLVTCKLVAL